MSNFPTVGQVAFESTLGFAAITVGAGVAAAGATSLVAAVALGALAIATAGAGIAAGTAYFATDNDDLKEYFENFKNHAGVVIGAEAQMVAQEVIGALVIGARRALSRKADRTFTKLLG